MNLTSILNFIGIILNLFIGIEQSITLNKTDIICDFSVSDSLFLITAVHYVVFVLAFFIFVFYRKHILEIYTFNFIFSMYCLIIFLLLKEDCVENIKNNFFMVYVNFILEICLFGILSLCILVYTWIFYMRRIIFNSTYENIS
jgi:hypothetical protein